MPYTAKQKRTFAAAAHDPKIAARVGISQADARKLQDEAGRTKTRPANTRNPGPRRKNK